MPVAFAGLAGAISAQVGTVELEQKISATAGDFGGLLSRGDFFGDSVEGIGDLNGDGVVDMVVGAPGSDDGGANQGSIWVLFLNSDGTVSAEQEISAAAGGFGGVLAPLDFFGSSLAFLGDLDGDGTHELAVGAPEDDDGGSEQGAVWILSLNSSGMVVSEQKISANGGFGGDLDPGDRFGISVCPLGDLDGDGIGDMAVGAFRDDDGDTDQGAVWILFLDSDGTAKSEQKISATAGTFGGALDPGDKFGFSVTCTEDLDGDGNPDIAVGAIGDNDGGFAQGAAWILFLNADGTVSGEQKISAVSGGFAGPLDSSDLFGTSVAFLDDLDGDNNPELAVGAIGDDDGGFPGISSQGAVWILFMNPDGTVSGEQKISATAGGFGGALDPFDSFGFSITSLGDLDGDGIAELAVGAELDDDGGADGFSELGAAWILFLEGRPCTVLDFETEDDLLTPLVNGQHIDTEFGSLLSITSTGNNAGVCIFDSTIGGPNDPSQDVDLLVNSGNVLILQTENLPPDGNDVFPRPNDDEDGGTLTLAFASPVEAMSVRLIDIDSTDRDSSIVMVDSSNLKRTYLVPKNWTGDLTVAEPGQGTLDLTTLAPQSGFGSVATASEDEGFDPLALSSLEFHLNGSIGIDDLGLCQDSQRSPSASALIRDGSGLNPSILSCAALPVLGGTFAANLDCSAMGPGIAVLEVRRTPTSGTTTIHGEVLVGGELVFRTTRAHPGSVSLLTWDVPADMALSGLSVHAQGLCRGGVTAFGRLFRFRSELSNALDLVLGL